MAVLYIAEFTGGPALGMDVAKQPPVVEQTVAIGSEAKSAAFNADTKVIRVHTDAICSILIGANPTATTSKTRMAANQTEYWVVNPGDKLSVISNT